MTEKNIKNISKLYREKKKSSMNILSKGNEDAIANHVAKHDNFDDIKQEDLEDMLAKMVQNYSIMNDTNDAIENSDFEKKSKIKKNNHLENKVKKKLKNENHVNQNEEQNTDKKTHKIFDHHVNHRLRMRDKFIKNDPTLLSDSELIELLLFYCIPRRDVKAEARILTNHFNNIRNLFFANNVDIKKILMENNKNINVDSVKFLLKLSRELGIRIAKQELGNGVILRNYNKIIDFLYEETSLLTIEQIKIFFLDIKGQLINIRTIGIGSVNEVVIYTRDILYEAMKAGAHSFIMAHNHPSGDVTPSKADCIMTDKISRFGLECGIECIDHVIIGKNKMNFSFRKNNLALQPFTDNALMQYVSSYGFSKNSIIDIDIFKNKESENKKIAQKYLEEIKNETKN